MLQAVSKSCVGSIREMISKHKQVLAGLAAVTLATASLKSQTNEPEELKISYLRDDIFAKPVLVQPEITPPSLLDASFRSYYQQQDIAALLSEFQTTLEKKEDKKSSPEIELRQSVIELAKDFAKDNLVTFIALGGAALLVFLRHFPNRVHIDVNQIASVRTSNGEEHSAKLDSKNTFIAPKTLLSANLNEFFGWDVYAFVRFHTALINAKINNHWPVLSFSNDKLISKFGGTVDDLLGRATRSEVSSILRGEDSSVSVIADAQSMLMQGLKTETLPRRDTVFLVYTFEDLDDIFQPRGYYIPAADVVNCLADIKDWWQAAGNTTAGAKRRLTRLFEISGSLLYRYPKMFDNLFGDNPKYLQAKQTAGELKKMFALKPKATAEFIDIYTSGNYEEDFLTPTKEHWELVQKTWYKTADKARQRELAIKEAQIVTAAQYTAFCKENSAPMWFFNLFV